MAAGEAVVIEGQNPAAARGPGRDGRQAIAEAGRGAARRPGGGRGCTQRLGSGAGRRRSPTRGPVSEREPAPPEREPAPAIGDGVHARPGEPAPISGERVPIEGAKEKADAHSGNGAGGHGGGGNGHGGGGHGGGGHDGGGQGQDPDPDDDSTSGSISAPFIRRPVATTLLMFGLLLAGITGYRQLPIAALPQVDYPTIVVTTQLPGASAETMASSVTTPLERQFGQVPSLAQMTSVSSFGSSQITLQFTLDRDIDSAEQDVQSAINAATNLLPRTLPAPPTYAKSNPADQPILTLAVTSDTLELPQISDFADSVLAQKISQVSGVGLVTMGGGQKPAVRVQVDPVALAGTGLTLEDVRAALAAANVNQPKGNVEGARQDWAIATNDQLSDAASFEPLIIAYRQGAAIRLGDVARVVNGVENAQLAGWSARSARSSSTSSASRARTSSRWPIRSRRSCRAWPRRCRRRSTSASSRTARSPCAPPSRTSSSRWRSRSCWSSR